jgi:hypothetical protein
MTKDMPPIVNLGDFLAQNMPIDEEASWGLLEDFYEDLQKDNDFDICDYSRYSRAEVIEALGILLQPRLVARRLGAKV